MMRFYRILFLGCLVFPIFSAQADNTQTAPDEAIRSCVQSGKYWDFYDKKCHDSKLSHDSVVAQNPMDDTDADCILKGGSFMLDAARRRTVAYRYRECGGEKAPAYVFDDRLRALYVGTGADKRRVAQFFDYAAGTLEKTILAKARPGLKPGETKRCAVSYKPDFSGYIYLPNEGYEEEVLAMKRPFIACGPYGVSSERIQFFRVLDDKVMVFFSLAEDDALDPRSFRLETTTPRPSPSF